MLLDVLRSLFAIFIPTASLLTSADYAAWLKILAELRRLGRGEFSILIFFSIVFSFPHGLSFALLYFKKTHL